MLRQRFAQTNHERNISIKAHCMLCCISSEQECLLSLSLFFLTLLLVCKKINNKVVFWKFYENTYFLLEIEWNFSHGTFFVYIKVQSSFFFFQFFSKKIGDFHERIQKEIQIPVKRHEPLSSLLHLLIWWLLWHRVVLVHSKIFFKSIF